MTGFILGKSKLVAELVLDFGPGFFGLDLPGMLPE